MVRQRLIFILVLVVLPAVLVAAELPVPADSAVADSLPADCRLFGGLEVAAGLCAAFSGHRGGRCVRRRGGPVGGGGPVPGTRAEEIAACDPRQEWIQLYRVRVPSYTLHSSSLR